MIDGIVSGLDAAAATRWWSCTGAQQPLRRDSGRQGSVDFRTEIRPAVKYQPKRP